MNPETFERAMNAVIEKLSKCKLSEKLKLKATAFVRERKLGAENLLRIILQRVYTSLQLAMDNFFEILQMTSVSKQAFSKARQNLNPEYVREYADEVAQIIAEDDSLPAYKGMRLIAIDGTDIALENTDELKAEFGCSGPKKDAATALASLAYGPLDHIIYDSRIGSYSLDERDLAIQHIERLTEIGLCGSLLLFDRWYPSSDFLSHILEKGFSFVARVRKKWNLEADAIKTQGWIQVGKKKTNIRVLKVKLVTGEIETLLTNLNQKQLPIREAADLYFKRWGIETAYDILKSKLQLENFSGKTKVSVLQDFYATIFLCILTSASAAVADTMISDSDKSKNLKYPRKSNINRVAHYTRKYFISLLLEPDPEMRRALMFDLYRLCSQHPVSIVPGRSPVRKKPRKKRFHITKKSVVC